MEVIATALGRLVPATEAQTVLEDQVLRLLFDYRMHPQNSKNVPMPLGNIVRALSADEQLVAAALDGLREQTPPLVEDVPGFQGPHAYRITGTGVRFVRNMPQGLSSLP